MSSNNVPPLPLSTTSAVLSEVAPNAGLTRSPHGTIYNPRNPDEVGSLPPSASASTLGSLAPSPAGSAAPTPRPVDVHSAETPAPATPSTSGSAATTPRPVIRAEPAAPPAPVVPRAEPAAPPAPVVPRAEPAAPRPAPFNPFAGLVALKDWTAPVTRPHVCSNLVGGSIINNVRPKQCTRAAVHSGLCQVCIVKVGMGPATIKLNMERRQFQIDVGHARLQQDREALERGELPTRKRKSSEREPEKARKKKSSSAILEPEDAESCRPPLDVTRDDDDDYDPPLSPIDNIVELD